MKNSYKSIGGEMMKITERPLIFFDFEVFKEDWLVVFIDYDTKRKCIIANDKE